MILSLAPHEAGYFSGVRHNVLACQVYEVTSAVFFQLPRDRGGRKLLHVDGAFDF
jgi:hypothetical protein